MKKNMILLLLIVSLMISFSCSHPLKPSLASEKTQIIKENTDHNSKALAAASYWTAYQINYVIKAQGDCTESFRRRTFLFRNYNEASRSAQALNAFHKASMDRKKQNFLHKIFWVLGGSKYKGTWTVLEQGKDYKVKFLYY